MSNTVPALSVRRRWIWFAGIAAVAVAADQATKLWAASALKGSGTTVRIIRDFLHLEYTENPGALFGLGRDLPPAASVAIFLVLSAVAIGFILYLHHRTQPTQRLLRIALALVMGGAVGNTIDRIYLGRVIDFIDVHNLPLIGRWPTFNVADIWIVVGIALLAIDAIFGRKKSSSGSPGA